MGPLVPDVFGSEFNLIFAILAGFGFGFILEQAGFSSAKKLVGLFYGYDFTVLRVFFTAGVTGMIGLILLDNFGLMDMSRVYINPTFLWSALIGGAIMGIGFIFGGYCPGTSICAASIGKLDAMVFVGGAFIGILLFSEGYPLWEPLLNAEAWGGVRLDTLTGWPTELWAFIISAIAIGSFYGVSLIEKKVNGEQAVFTREFKLRFATIAAIPVLLVLFTAIKPSRAESIMSKVNDAEYQQATAPEQLMQADKLADQLMNHNYEVNLIDVRSAEEYKKSHLPLAVNVPFAELQKRDWNQYFTRSNKVNVFYGATREQAMKASLLANIIGQRNSYFIAETPAEFNHMFYELEAPASNASHEIVNTYHFRRQAGEKLRYLEEALKRFSSPVKRKAVKVQGGC
ncbi:MAG: YeeE/YedE family protein [Leptospiraceae bacterium]|nr:YeeE/YedE family protein [Leptospiraceae bacterium]